MEVYNGEAGLDTGHGRIVRYATELAGKRVMVCPHSERAIALHSDSERFSRMLDA